ncbi:zinc finger BED domain-containing protein [Elysia marginata]|uniref:Zinc finger BED domain-containing protein n=1 Tax=Elysia marginata TaxID=1093978 RepID=A0AAV4JJL1_9GAST|nr:zinc finger BED domain-containing protein [Elysia marginata]
MWNSIFDMLKSYLGQHEETTTVLCFIGKNSSCLDPNEVTVAQEAMRTLEPFYEATTKLSSEKHISLSKIIPMVKILGSERDAFLQEYVDLSVSLTPLGITRKSFNDTTLVIVPVSITNQVVVDFEQFRVLEGQSQKRIFQLLFALTAVDMTLLVSVVKSTMKAYAKLRDTETALDDFLHVDDEVISTEELTTQEIVEKVQVRGGNEAGDEDDDESEPIPIVSSKTATEAITALQQFLMQQEDGSTLLKDINKFKNFVEKKTALRQRKQTTKLTFSRHIEVS